MSVFLDTLKQRWVDAHQRQKESGEALVALQAKHAVNLQENLHWQKAYEMEKLREEQAEASAKSDQIPLIATATESIPPDTTITEGSKAEVNKTELVLDLLRQHPSGMWPGDIWTVVHAEFKGRAYLYSILKRLKDREQVRVRNGKYFIRVPSKPEEAKLQVAVQ